MFGACQLQHSLSFPSKSYATKKIQASGSVFSGFEGRQPHRPYIMHWDLTGFLEWKHQKQSGNEWINQICFSQGLDWVRWLVNETDGRHRLLTLPCSWSRSWFLIKLIIYQKTPSCFLEGGEDKLCSTGCLNTWPHGKMVSWSVLKWQNIRGLLQMLRRLNTC